MRQYSTLYTIGFSAAVCIVCSFLVSASAVSLKARQEENALLDTQKNVLMAAGLVQPGASLTRDQVTKRFDSVSAVIVDLKNGQVIERILTQNLGLIGTVVKKRDLESVGILDHVQVVFDDHDHVPSLHQPVEHADQLLHVSEVQAGGRFVEQEAGFFLSPGQFCCELQPLGLPPAQRIRRLSQGQVAQPNVLEWLEASHAGAAV